MKTSTRIFLGLALGLLSAVLYILTFQPYSVWPLAFVVFVPMLIAEHRILPLRWSGLARGIAVGLFLLVFLVSLFGFSELTGIFIGVAGAIALVSALTAPKLPFGKMG